MATTTVIATAVIPISQLRRECANKFAGRIVFGYPCSVGRRLDKPYVLIAGSRPTAREVLYSGCSHRVDVHNCSDHAALR